MDSTQSSWGSVASSNTASVMGSSLAVLPAGKAADRPTLFGITLPKPRVGLGDLVTFVRHLTALLGSGLALAKSLRTVGEQVENETLAEATLEVSREVESGSSFSAALSQRPDVFDALTVNVVRAAEVGGTLPESLLKLAGDLEKRRNMRRAIVGVLAYPLIVMSIGTLLVTALLLFVVPVFEQVFAKMKIPLPAITRVLLWTSRISIEFWWAFPIVIVALAYAWRRAKKSEVFRYRWDKLMLRLPLVGKARRRVLAARFLSAFATLTQSGVSIVEALRLLGDLLPNAIIREALQDIQKHVTRGGRFTERMSAYRQIFPPMAVQMVSLGEDTGTLPDAAAQAAEFMTEEVDRTTKNLMTLAEPVLTVVMGIVVAAIAMAIHLPMFDMMNAVKR